MIQKLLHVFLVHDQQKSGLLLESTSLTRDSATKLMKLVMMTTLLFVTLQATHVLAIGQKLTGGYWAWQHSVLQPHFYLDVDDSKTWHPIPLNHIKLRINTYQNDPRIEPLAITINYPYDLSRQKFARKYALNPYVTEAIEEYLSNEPRGILPIRKKHRQGQEANTLPRRVILGNDILPLLDLFKLQRKFLSPGYAITIDGESLRQDKKKNRKFLHQIQPFIGLKNTEKISQHIARGQLITPQLFLPEFPRNMLNKHMPFRGPNCFHAAMAFQDKSLITMARTNLRREPKHHHLMINHDELWHILNWYFYEIDPVVSPLKFGDVLVFLDVPPKHSTQNPANFRWIVHASAFLFNDFVFSKGSKSPNSAYTIKTIDDEWRTWKKIAKHHLAVKVFRRNYFDVKNKSPIISRNGWLY
ncbi:MAG: hypothetical protein OXC40_03320 [Proteobacteria bacterium]|nr:hypothetical protein [Pseudomonadota bacterium]